MTIGWNLIVLLWHLYIFWQVINLMVYRVSDVLIVIVLSSSFIGGKYDVYLHLHCNVGLVERICIHICSSFLRDSSSSGHVGIIRLGSIVL